MSNTMINGSLSLRVLFIMLTVLVLAACGTMSNRFDPSTLPDAVPNSTFGVVLLSAGAKEKCTSTGTFFKVLKEDQGYFSGELGLLSVDSYVFKSDFPDFHGNVHALTLAPGRYYLAPWLANPYFSPTRVTRFDFEVKAGEFTYLGNYYMSKQCGTSTAGVFTDRWERDLAIILAKKPNLDILLLRKQILKPTGLAVGSN